MQGLHSLAHRAPTGATRAKVRWQPYTALPPSLPSSRSPTTTTYINTPLSVSSASPYSTPASFDSDKLKYQSVISSNSKDSSSKHTKYALGLVDQAVKSLCEIWRDSDIPAVFLTTLSSTSQPFKQELVSTAIHTRNIQQLPSPVSPNTRHSPPASQQSHCEQQALFGSHSNLVPIKGFVHEVLRRSRTSGGVLQTALCYLEAIRNKIPELVEQERSGTGSKREPDLGERITPATPAEIEQDAELTRQSLYDDESSDDATMDTVKISDLGGPAQTLDQDCHTASSSEPLTPLPPLPSPLLCPRRAFLAALILASKFTQDKCYSNRAWAKLSGLPPREIGRCERALGDALDWRLWVGKRPVQATQPTSSPAPPLVTRPLVRCQSESNLQTPTKKTKFLAQDDSSDPKPNGNALRRSSTLPANAFSTNGQGPSTASTSSNLIPPPNDIDYPMMVETSLLSMIPSDYTQLSSDPSVCPPTEVLDPNPPITFSPCPSLSYSPSSTDSSSSSSGDRTIQMPILDDMPSLSMCSIASSSSNPDSTWLWSESPIGATYAQQRFSPAIRAGLPPPPHALGKHPLGISHFKQAPAVAAPHIQIAESTSGPDFLQHPLVLLGDPPWNSAANLYRWPAVQ